jgi:hypothetical protein
MQRRTLYGGERGIRSREADAIQKLLTTAQSDFRHDFGEKVAARDLFTADDTVRFTEIARGYGIGKVKALVTGFNSVIGSTPYTLVSDAILDRIYPITGSQANYMTEDGLLDHLGIKYGEIKKKCKDKLAEVAAQARSAAAAARIVRPADVEELVQNALNNATLTIDNLEFAAPGGEIRTYEVTAVLMKDKTGEGTLNIASQFQRVTRGKNKFVMIIDASGGLSMTSIINTDIKPLPPGKTEFYILENIENDADSATKLKNIDKPKLAGNEAVKPDVYFLKDDVNTVLYPKFNTAISQAYGEVLFGNADVVLSRAGDEVEAEFTFPSSSRVSQGGMEEEIAGETYHIENLAENGNVKNASLNILASALAEGATIDAAKKLVVPPGVKRPFLFAFSKRIGDMAQAACLGDGTRKYTVLDMNHQPIARPSITLDEFRKQADTAIGLLTLDRILLGYALSLGEDVFFTTASDLRLLLYFHNTESVLTPAEYAPKIAALKAEVDAVYNPSRTGDVSSMQIEEVPSTGADNVVTILKEGVASILGSTTEVELIQRTRAVFYRLSVLRSEFETLEAKLASNAKELQNPALTPEKTYGVYLEQKTILQKLAADAKHNELQRTSFSTYPRFVLEKGAFQTIQTRPTSRAAISELKVILSKHMYDDAVQCKKLFKKYGQEPLLASVLAKFVTPNEPYNEIFKSFAVIASVLTDTQIGGGPEDIERLKQFVVTPMSIEEHGFAANEPARYADYPLPLVIDTYYRDEKSHPYTVVDQYIITREDLYTFDRVASVEGGFTSAARLPTEQKFLATRLLLLYLDILQGELEALVASDDDQILEGVGTIPSDVKHTNHKRIYYKASQLSDTYTTYLGKDEFESAFVDAMNSYKGADLLDNDEINRLAVGSEGIRDPRDFNRTLVKIQTARGAIVAYYRKAVKGMKKETPAQKKPPKTTATSVSSRTRKDRIDAALEQSNTETREGAIGGDLQATPSLYTNVQKPGHPQRSFRKHSRLRKRARTRRTPRV